MVDAAASFEAKAAPHSGAPARSRHVEINVAPASIASIAAYAKLCEDCVLAPTQNALWLHNWSAQAGSDVLVATISKNGEPVFALALDIVSSGPFRVGRFMGGTHANGNFAPASRHWLATPTAADIAALADAVRMARPDLDALLLQRLATDLDGFANPLLALPHAPSPNVSLAVDLQDGFDAVLGQSSARRKRKKHRAQMRKFEAAGGLRRIVASTENETRRLFDAFLAMKEQRFRKAGMANVFADAEIQAFFHALFAEAVHSDPPVFTLEGLEVGGKLRAVTGTSRHGRRLICEFGGILDDELAVFSPGEFLYYENIEQACADGFAVYDFGVGDEPYKRLWCNIETLQADVVMPLSAKGKILATGLRLSGRLKAFVKNSPLIWKIAKALRKRAAGKLLPAGD